MVLYWNSATESTRVCSLLKERKSELNYRRGLLKGRRARVEHPLLNGRRSVSVRVRGPVEVFPRRERLMLGSRRAILLVVGSLPSRAVATMSLRGNTSPPLVSLANCL